MLLWTAARMPLTMLVRPLGTLDGFGRNGMLMVFLMWPTGWWKSHILSFLSWYCDLYPIWLWRITKIKLLTIFNYCPRKMWNPDFDLKDQTWLGLTDEEASSNHTVHWCSITSHESAKQPNGPSQLSPGLASRSFCRRSCTVVALKLSKHGVVQLVVPPHFLNTKKI